MEGIVSLFCALISILVVTTVAERDCVGPRYDCRVDSIVSGKYYIRKRAPLDPVYNRPHLGNPFAKPQSIHSPREKFTTQSKPKNDNNDTSVENDAWSYNKNLEYILNDYQNKGKFIYNIYNKQHLSDTIHLCRLFGGMTTYSHYRYTEFWSNINMNIDMYDYAIRLALLKNPTEFYLQDPWYLIKPHYFFNARSMAKAYEIRKNDLRLPHPDPNVHINKSPHVAIINANYSSWQAEKQYYDRCNFYYGIKYFTEDLELNSYYYGLHLLYPYWMADEVLNEMDIRYGEHYYFVHKQLLARYKLEMEQYAQSNIKFNNGSDERFNPDLMLETNTHFRTRILNKDDWLDNEILKSIIVNVRLNISKGVVFLNDHHHNVTESNHMDLISRYLRDRFDGPITAPIIRAVLCNCNHTDKSAPTVFDHPSTTLRDPFYWYVMENVLNIITHYQELYLNPLNLSNYETKDYRVVDFTYSNLVTHFENYKILTVDSKIYTRLRRLAPDEIEFNITIESKHKGLSVVRIFLGPPCSNESCWDVRNSFFQLDAFKFNLNPGMNKITWYPQRRTYSSDVFYNEEYEYWVGTTADYSTFLFPKRLILPKGMVTGLEAVIFIMVTPGDLDYKHARQIDRNDYIFYVDEKPLGFPFHRKAQNFNFHATNYKFFNVTIFHEVEGCLESIFTPNLH